VEVKEECQVKISHRFAATENIGNNDDINRVSENTRDNTKILAAEILGYYELKHHKPWFDEEYSKLLD